MYHYLGHVRHDKPTSKTIFCSHERIYQIVPPPQDPNSLSRASCMYVQYALHPRRTCVLQPAMPSAIPQVSMGIPHCPLKRERRSKRLHTLQTPYRSDRTMLERSRNGPLIRSKPVSLNPPSPSHHHHPSPSQHITVAHHTSLLCTSLTSPPTLHRCVPLSLIHI